MIRAAACASLLCVALGARPAAAAPWPLWEAYVEHFISADGRVIDPTGGHVTTSEGQSYALFFALVAGDRPLFDRLLRWTRDNLSHGHLDKRLPAYKWGQRRDGTWGVLDENSAADSDLWLGYVLVEAGRLWSNAELDRVGRSILRLVVEREVAHLPGLGPMLLPAPRGFQHGRRWRLNPSYLPLQLLRGLETEGVPGPWREIRTNAVRMLSERSTHGFVDDWVGYQARGFYPDPVRGAIGSYDAIRVYLWHQLLDPRDVDGARLVLDGPYEYWKLRGRVPERIDTRRPASNARPGPVGFLAVLLPRAQRSGDGEALAELEQAIERSHKGRLYGSPPTYYDQNLILFSQGFVEARYRFDLDGRLTPSWALARSPK